MSDFLQDVYQPDSKRVTFFEDFQDTISIIIASTTDRFRSVMISMRLGRMTARSIKDLMRYSRCPGEPARIISSTTSSRISLSKFVRCESSIISLSLRLWILTRYSCHGVLSHSLSTPLLQKDKDWNKQTRSDTDWLPYRRASRHANKLINTSKYTMHHRICLSDQIFVTVLKRCVLVSIHFPSFENASTKT